MLASDDCPSCAPVMLRAVGVLTTFLPLNSCAAPSISDSTLICVVPTMPSLVSRSPSRIVPGTLICAAMLPRLAARLVLPACEAAVLSAPASWPSVMGVLSAVAGDATPSVVCNALIVPSSDTLPPATEFQSSTLTLTLEPSSEPSSALSRAPCDDVMLASRGPATTQPPPVHAPAACDRSSISAVAIAMARRRRTARLMARPSRWRRRGRRTGSRRT